MFIQNPHVKAGQSPHQEARCCDQLFTREMQRNLRYESHLFLIPTLTAVLLAHFFSSVFAYSWNSCSQAIAAIIKYLTQTSPNDESCSILIN